MKIGMITDSLGALSFDDLLGTAAELGIEQLEFAGGNWSPAPHLLLDRMLDSAPARGEFMARLRDHGLSLSALNCSGNPLHPGETGRRHQEVTRKTIALASLLGVERVVMMSGCPGGPGDANANWVTTSWPPETQTILRYQWQEVRIPYWQELVAYAQSLGVEKLCLELHGHQNVYNVDTFFRIRDAVGETVGVNFDPSHLISHSRPDRPRRCPAADPHRARLDGQISDDYRCAAHPLGPAGLRGRRALRGASRRCHVLRSDPECRRSARWERSCLFRLQPALHRLRPALRV